MKRNDLHVDLRGEYNKEIGYGVEKGADKHKNIWFVIPKPLIKNKITIANGRLKEFLKALTPGNRTVGKLKKLNEMDDVDRLISFLFTRKEAMLSSSMEGTYTTIDEALISFGKKYDDSQQKSPQSSVRSYAKSLEEVFYKIQSGGFGAISLEMICGMHRNIMSKDPSFSGTPGMTRDISGKTVHIGGGRSIEQSIYNPAPAGHVGWLMKDFINWLKNPDITEFGDASIGSNLSLPVRMAVSHLHFEAIHPFSDGNGRVGRMILPIQMMLSSLMPIYLSGYIDKYKDEYYNALKEGQQKLNYIPMIGLMGDALAESYQYTLETRTFLEKIRDDWRAKLNLRKGSGAERLLDHVLGKPLLTANEVSESLKISFPRAVDALNKLENFGVLSERTGFKRNKVYACEKVIALISRDFDESAEACLAKLDKDMMAKNTKLVTGQYPKKIRNIKVGTSEKKSGKVCKGCGHNYRIRKATSPERAKIDICKACFDLGRR